VLVQYEHKLNTEKLRSFVHGLQKALPKKRFNFQLAEEREAAELTGFVHNAVTPFGLKTRVPVCLCIHVWAQEMRLHLCR
jgi:prolyl-tRNA editing enzyme YbaK/EbsC (Cys-tRNA(Pro) deacylase)